MKYNLLLKFLRALISIKRFFWWIFSYIFVFFGWVFGPILRFFGYIGYKLNYFSRKIGVDGHSGNHFMRIILQPTIFFVLLLVVLPQTKLINIKNPLPGQKTIAFSLFGDTEEYSIEEITATTNGPQKIQRYDWRTGVVGIDENSGMQGELNFEQDLAGVVANGMAISKPNIMTGSVGKGGARKQPVEYIIESGDSLSSIAYRFGVSVATIMWENDLGLRSTLKLGQKLIIPPATGVMHTIKKGDNLKKIANLYGAKMEDIIKFNNLNEDGTDLKIGEKIMVPGGEQLAQKAIAKAPRTSKTFKAVVRPPSSRQSPGASGFVWPSGARSITQYFGWKHHGVDIAGPFETPTYAAKAGTVEKAQCGWNSGYGCYVIIDHGGGIKTLYGHHSRLLVSPGDYVEAGQTIGLMGNTGKVRGRTGIHLHFEVMINGGRVNPLGYVR